MRDDLIARWADLLVDYCLKVERGETIVIGSELEARPLVEAASKAVILRGAYPLVRLEIPGLHEFFLEHAEDEQLAHLPPSAMAEAESVDARIRIAADSDTRSMSLVDPRCQARYECGTRAGPAGRSTEAMGAHTISDRRLRHRRGDEPGRL